jgi:hypothetical protein
MTTVGRATAWSHTSTERPSALVNAGRDHPLGSEDHDRGGRQGGAANAFPSARISMPLGGTPLGGARFEPATFSV